MHLSPHFTLAELTTSATAKAKKMANIAPPAIIANLKKTAEKLEEIRIVLGNKPMHINSGYRSPGLNKAIGGSKKSAHMEGFAADFVCPAFGTPFEICQAIIKAGIKFDQLIYEPTWVHISVNPKMRQHLLTIKDGKTSLGINK